MKLKSVVMPPTGRVYIDIDSLIDELSDRYQVAKDKLDTVDILERCGNDEMTVSIMSKLVYDLQKFKKEALSR